MSATAEQAIQKRMDEMAEMLRQQSADIRHMKAELDELTFDQEMDRYIRQDYT